MLLDPLCSMFGTARVANEALGIVQDVAAMQVLLLNQGMSGLRYLSVSNVFKCYLPHCRQA
jgi:hypothetical protein